MAEGQWAGGSVSAREDCRLFAADALLWCLLCCCPVACCAAPLPLPYLSSCPLLPTVCPCLSLSASVSPRSCSAVIDVLIVGVGAQGVSAAYHLAKADQRVLGLERYTIAHANASSHGETRITRLAYWEHPAYVPLLRRSFALFAELEAETGEKLFHQTGSMDVGPETEATFQGSLLSCQTHGLEHEVMTPDELAARFPAWRVPAHYRACFQPAGGMLFPEKIIAATARLAKKHGAEIRENTEVTDIIPTGDGVTVLTSDGQRFRGRKVLLCAGAWLGSLVAKSALGLSSPRLRRLSALLRPERQVVTWYEPTAEALSASLFEPARHPVWVATLNGSHYYGFPLLRGASPGVKIGRYHHAFEALDSEAQLNDLHSRQRTTHSDRTYTDEFMRRMFTGLKAGPEDAVLKSSTCLFTNTPDEHFIIDPLVDAAFPQVMFLSACSGHGFKFSSVIGEIIAGFVTKGAEAVEKDLPVRWLDAGRLLGDREAMQTLDPHIEMKAKQIALSKL